MTKFNGRLITKKLKKLGGRIMRFARKKIVNDKNILRVYDYKLYLDNFTKWRKDTIVKIESLNKDEICCLEDQVARQRGYDEYYFSKTPVIGELNDFVIEMAKIFFPKLHRESFYTQLNMIIQDMKNKKSDD